MKLSVAEKASVDKVVVEKYNVAWFKLAEFVVRKEKERALGVYKLLSHSLPDDAFAAQLEGDLFMAFNDEKACDAYHRAAKLYEKSGQHAHAALIYEQIMLIRPENTEYVVQALSLYQSVKNDAKVARCASQLARLLVKQGDFDAQNNLIASLTDWPETLLPVQEACVVALMEFHAAERQLIQDYLTVILQTPGMRSANSKRLALFLAKVSALDSTWHAWACDFLKSHE